MNPYFACLPNDAEKLLCCTEYSIDRTIGAHILTFERMLMVLTVRGMSDQKEKTDNARQRRWLCRLAKRVAGDELRRGEMEEGTD